MPTPNPNSDVQRKVPMQKTMVGSLKSLSVSEGALALTFAVTALVSFFIAAMAHTPEYAFHASLFAAGSAAAVFAIVERYFNRPAAPVPSHIDGKPNYNMGPVKFATVAAVIW